LNRIFNGSILSQRRLSSPGASFNSSFELHCYRSNLQAFQKASLVLNGVAKAEITRSGAGRQDCVNFCLFQDEFIWTVFLKIIAVAPKFWATFLR
jgi:hypothetical protein